MQNYFKHLFLNRWGSVPSVGERVWNSTTWIAARFPSKEKERAVHSGKAIRILPWKEKSKTLSAFLFTPTSVCFSFVCFWGCIKLHPKARVLSWKIAVKGNGHTEVQALFRIETGTLSYSHRIALVKYFHLKPTSMVRLQEKKCVFD